MVENDATSYSGIMSGTYHYFITINIIVVFFQLGVPYGSINWTQLIGVNELRVNWLGSILWGQNK